MSAKSKVALGDARRAEHRAQRAETSSAFRRLARVGIGARALVYVVLAVLAMEIAVSGRSSAPADTEGTFSIIDHQPGGPVLLAALAAGLLAYAAFRVVQGVAGTPEPDRNALIARVGWLVSGALYVALFADAVLLISGSGSSGGPSSHPEPLVRTVLSWPVGPELLGLIAAAVTGGGIGLGVWGILHDYGEVLDGLLGRAMLWARTLGVIGDLGRGAVVVLVGATFFYAAVTHSARHAKGVDAALQSLVGLPGGRELLGVLAVGLFAYGAYSAVEARYRRI